MPVVVLSNVDRVGRFNTGNPISIEGLDLNSIEAAFWVIVSIKQGLPSLAREIWQNKSFRSKPSLIAPWIESKFTIHSQVLFNAGRIMFAILKLLAQQQDSQVCQYFRYLHGKYSDSDVQFRFATGKPEFVWSCALKASDPRIRRREDFSFNGYNLYGFFLKMAYNGWRDGRFVEEYTIQSLLHSASIFSVTGGVPRSALILSDSECRQVLKVQSGHVIRRSGAHYHDLAHEIDRQNVDVTQFQFIVIMCGVNLSCVVDEDHWLKSWKSLERRLQPLIYDGSPYRILLNSPIWTPRMKYQYFLQHCQWARQTSSHIPNLTFFDWSFTHDNPFTILRGHKRPMQNPRLMCRDHLHVNHAGFRHLWAAWVKKFQSLITISYSLTRKFYQGDGPTNCV